MRQRVALIAKIRAIESVPVIRFKVRDTFNFYFFNLHLWTAMLLYFAQTLRVELLRPSDYLYRLLLDQCGISDPSVRASSFNSIQWTKCFFFRFFF